MSAIVCDVFKVLSGAIQDIAINENAGQCELKACFHNQADIDKDALEEALKMISDRDSYVLSIFQDDSEVCSSRDGIDSILTTLSSPLYQMSKIEAKLKIIKRRQDFTLSVYDYASFSDYMINLPLKSFLDVIGQLLEDGYITIECFDEEAMTWETKSILVKKYNEDTQLTIPDIKQKNEIVETRKGLCHWDKNIDYVVPGDFFIANGSAPNDVLQKSFIACSVVLMLMFIFDYSTLEREKLRYKLSGYKTVSGEIDTLCMANIDFTIGCFTGIRNIYEWCYYYGQHDEKIAIARNILSLNATFPERGSQSLAIHNYTFDTIKSNYKFFEKEHIRQFVEIHGKLMDSVLSLQSRVVAAVDSFIKEFKSVFFVTVSFITSSVVVRSVSRDSFLSKPLLIIAGIIILIYIASYFYYSGELDGKITLMKEQYDKIRRRYGTLLSKSEKIEVFGEDGKYGSTIEFAEKQLKTYTCYWVAISILLLIVDVVAFFVI